MAVRDASRQRVWVKGSMAALKTGRSRQRLAEAHLRVLR